MIENTQKTITIDPKMFISEPFTLCPNCKQKEFGVLTVHSYSYVKRCRNCWHDKTYGLPRLFRKIIYIDQFAISNMMKSINPHTGKMNKVDPFFKTLFEKLDTLNKLQLIICPDSNNHFNESIVSPHYKFLKRMYEQLSHGTTFYDPETIKRFEVTEAFHIWMGEEKRQLDIGSVLMGNNIDGWQERLILSVSLRDQNPQLAIDIRQERDATSAALEKIFKRWQTESTRSFNDWYEEEINGFGKAIFKSYLSSIQFYEAVATGQVPVNIKNISSFMSGASITMTYIHDKLSERGFQDEELFEKSTNFLNSDEIKEIPYAKISSIMFAALAREAALGRIKPPTKGMMNDIEIIAAYAPYCDALFVDNECRRLINNKEAKAKYNLSDKLFSQDNKESFLNYLDEIKKTASKEHLQLVKEVYGESWTLPYVKMFG